MVQNGKPLGQMIIELGLDSTGFSSSLTGATRAAKTAVREMGTGFKVLDSGGNKLDALSYKQQALTKVISAQTNELGHLKQAYDKTLDSQGNATSKTAAAAQKYNDAQARLSGYKQELINTAGSLAELQVKTTGATGAILAGSEKMISAGKGMENIGSAMTKGLTLPILAGATAVTTAAISWESAFAGVKKTNDEVTDSTGKVVYSYKDLENGLRGLAKELPSSHQEIAAVAEAAGQLGIETPNVVGFTKTMIDLGESTNMSAETAATSLARFANITQMSQGDFDRLGAVIVDLGNNFATTESEITEMGLRLAGAGKQIGMSQGEIMGFAAALSSVGIEAEAGGSAFSKVMVQMQLAVEKGTGAFTELEQMANTAGYSIGEVGQAVLKGGKPLKSMAESLGMNSKELSKMYKEADKSRTSLEDFSKVAGMTGEQFSQAFKDDPSQAIIKFIEGLKNAESQGTSAIKVLDDMGITEVRLRDSLLRASNASGVFSGAIEMGNKAWSENTALTEEANKRYETTESKLKMLKNEVIDSAIELGGPFVDALRSGLESSKPLIKSLGDLAKSFSDADPKTQQMIVKLLAATAAAGPLLSITGKLTGGIGSLGKSFVELSAQMAKKKAIAELSEQLVNGTVNVNTLSTALGGGATKVGAFGSAAGTAAGSSGIGAMSAALGPLGPAILGIVGVGGALAVGYGAWKLFGEEAWNSSQRVQRWGTDVGEATDKTLVKIQEDTQKASGQFGIMVQGFETDSGSMVANFEKIGQTIEQSLINKIEGLDKLIKELPESVDVGLKDMAQEEKKIAEDSLKIVQENTARITEIRQNASNNNREISVAEASIIQDLAKNTTRAYVDTLKISENEKKNVLNAMNADVANATEEEAKLWLQSLGKQRQVAQENAQKSREEKEKYIQELGYSLDSEFAQKFLKAWDEINKTTTDGFDSQIAAIAKKYPELMDEVWVANGQLINGNDQMAQSMINSNKEIVDSANSMADKVAENAEKNAERLAWKADENIKNGKKAAQVWNDLVFDEKNGEVKSNVREVVTEASKDSATWNQIRFQLQNADLDSNAKLIIGEAAIANGWWDGMAWEDKQAVLKDEFSQNMYKALEDSGKWKELNFEQKKAILYSNTPEIMAETMLNLGLWKDYQPAIKELKANNFEFLSILNGSKERLNHWNGLPADIKEIIGDNYDFLEKIYSSESALNRWKALPDDQKRLLGDNTNFMSQLMTSETAWNRWHQLPDDQKNLLANNSDLIAKVFSSEEAYNAWKGLPDSLKKMFADNVDLKSKLADGTLSLEVYNANEPKIKKLLGDSVNVQVAAAAGEAALNQYDSKNPLPKLLQGDPFNVVNATNQGNQALNQYESNNPLTKNLLGNALSVINASGQGEQSLNRYSSNNPTMKNLLGNPWDVVNSANQGGQALDRFSANNPLAKNLRANDLASGPALEASGAINDFNSKPSTITKTLQVVASFGSSVAKILGLEKGTNYHMGGPAIVNDQSGSNYKELVIPKGGTPFIAEGRDVLLPDLPRGSKVLNARKTKQLIPHYANGVGIPENSTIVKNLRNINAKNEIVERTQIESTDYTSKFEELIRVMRNFDKSLKNLQLVVNDKVMANAVTNVQQNRKNMLEKVGGK